MVLGIAAIFLMSITKLLKTGKKAINTSKCFCSELQDNFRPDETTPTTPCGDWEFEKGEVEVLTLNFHT